ncbi:MAG TPA: Ig-like domain-containing protein [Roseiarcus sp.]|nr:Ig-like domain-containing protein [Roseiarcus sp.]
MAVVGSATGASGAPNLAGGSSAIAAELPNLLSGYASRPNWQVAGVDYGVGVDPNLALVKPTANNLPAGASLNNNAIYVDGSNVTLSGYDLTGMTVMVNDDASGTVTVENCGATSGVNIRSTVNATANLVVQNCTLDGGYGAADQDFQLIKVWCPLTVLYSVIKDAPGGIYEGGNSLTVEYNLLQGFGEYEVNHANAIYVAGSNDSSVTSTIEYNTLYSETTRSSSFPVTGLGAAIAFFDDGGNFYHSTVSNNTVVSAMADAASYLIGYYVGPGHSATGGVVSNNYVASVNGFNNSGSGAFGAFYTGSSGTVQATYADNYDMSNGNLISSGNAETPAGPATPTAPTAPTISSWSPDSGVVGDGVTNATQLTLTGSANANSSVAVYNGSAVLGNTTANASGAWTYVTSTLSAGAHAFTATDTVSGATSAASGALNVTIDATAPAAPVETGDSIVNGNQVAVSGTAAANTTITIYDGGNTVVGTGVTNSSGNWSVTTSALSNGSHFLSATATDAAGNVSVVSAALDPVIGAISSPAAPTFASWSPDTGVTGDGITDANKLTFKGSAVAGGTVRIYDGSTLLSGVTAGSTGAWSYTTAALADGTHAFTATDTVSGATSAASGALKVTIDATAPAAPVETGDSIVNGNQVAVTGTAAANTTITIYDGTALVGSGAANASGAWKITSSALSVGAHTLTATATDAAGNVSAASAALLATIAKAPTATPLSFTGLWEVLWSRVATIGGVADPKSTVKIYDGTTLVGTTAANSSGKWHVTTGSLGYGTEILTAQEVNRFGAVVAKSSGEAILGSWNSDVLTSTPGDDVFFGGGSFDTFKFQAGFGHDLIADGGVGDTFYFSKTEFANFTDLLSHTSQIGSSTVIAAGADKLTLANTPLSSLVASQFHFV